MKNFIGRIREFKGEPVYEILAMTKESKDFFIVYRETIDGKKYARNLLYYNVYGYKAEGKPERKLYKCTLKETPHITAAEEYTATEYDLEPILKKYPNFKYIVQKWGGMLIYDCFQILRTWLKHPEMEIMLNLGYRSLASNKSFLKMNRSRQKEIVSFARQNNIKNPSAIYVMGAIKNKCTYDEFQKYSDETRRYKVSFQEWKDLKGISIYDFTRYKHLLQKYFPTRLLDEYWTKFKDLKDFHRKERKAQRQADAIDKAANEEKLQVQQEAYSKAIKKFREWKGEFEGIEVYVPTDVTDFNTQADKLKQCLVWNDYAGLVIDKKIIMVFLHKKNKPIATAEFSRKNFELLQFRGLHNCDVRGKCEKALQDFQTRFMHKSA